MQTRTPLVLLLLSMWPRGEALMRLLLDSPPLQIVLLFSKLLSRVRTLSSQPGRLPMPLR